MFATRRFTKGTGRVWGRISNGAIARDITVSLIRLWFCRLLGRGSVNGGIWVDLVRVASGELRGRCLY